MDYEWDPNKAKLNFRKHGVVTMGMDALGRVLVVVYTWRK